MLGEPQYTISEFDVKQLKEYDTSNRGSDYCPGVDKSKISQFPSSINILDYYAEIYKDECTKNRPRDERLHLVLERKRITAINNISKLVGYIEFTITGRFGSIRSGLIHHGFILSADSILDLGKDMHPNDVNDSEQVIGWVRYKNNLSTHAFLWQDGNISIIQHNARAIAINNYGDIVGDMRTRMPKAYQEAFIFTDGMVYDLLSLVVNNDSWSHLEYASDINDAGEIVGYGYRAGKLTGFLLTPL